MVKTAEANDIPWKSALAWIQSHGEWSEETLENVRNDDVVVPAYYQNPFHAYEEGNLCWEAAWEQV